MKLESESRSGSSPRQCECECWSSSSQCKQLCENNEDEASSVRESDQAWHSMVSDAAIKRRYSQHCVPCSPSLVDSLRQKMLEDHSSEESSMDKKNPTDSREILARSQYDESDTAVMINGIKHPKLKESQPLVYEEHNRVQKNTLLDRPYKCREMFRVLTYITIAVSETVAWIKLFNSLEGNSERDYILLLLCLPTLSSLVVLVSLIPTWRSVYQLKNGSTAAIICVLLFSIPSPIFLHLYYLFNLIWRRSSAGSRKCRLLQNLSIVMQLCRALTGSLPLLLYGIYILIQRMMLFLHHVLDIKEVTLFVEQNMMYEVSMFLSLLGLVVSVHRYNERQTGLLVSCLVSVPFILATVTTRVLASAIILAFYPLNWSLVLFSSLIAGLAVIQAVCETQRSGGREAGRCGLARLVCALPGRLVRAGLGLVSPMGYNNDGGVDQSRVRGGLLVILNYILVMTGLGLGLATTVLYYVPNNYHGLVMGGMNLKVDIPETQVILRTGSGLDLKVKMAATQVDLANSQHMEAAILTDEGLDLAVSVALPCLMLLLTLPLTLTRLALLGLDCVVIQKEEKGFHPVHRRAGRGRVGVSLCCGLLAALVCSLVLVTITAGLAAKFTSGH